MIAAPVGNAQRVSALSAFCDLSRGDRPLCHSCLASAQHSNAAVHIVKTGLLLVITSGATECRRKQSGGDIWVVRFEGNQTLWRSTATDHDNGQYSVYVPAVLHQQVEFAHVQLWWTATTPPQDFLEHTWNQSGSEDVNSAKLKLGPIDRSFTNVLLEGHSTVCVGKELSGSPLKLTAVLRAAAGDNASGSSPGSGPIHHMAAWAGSRHESRCPDGFTGHWSRSSHHRRDVHGREVHGRYLWLPYAGCNGKPPVTARWGDLDCDTQRAAACLEGRQLILIGDSVLAGTFADLCALMSSGRKDMCDAVPLIHSEVRPQNISVLPKAQLVWIPAFGLPGKQGLSNMVGDVMRMREWERLLSTASKGAIIIMQSGLHDVAPPGTNRVAPLLTYRLNLRRLAQLVLRIQRHAPSLTFVWRATTHSLLMPDVGEHAQEDGCPIAGYPQSHPTVVSKLNSAARDVFRRTGVLDWWQPAPLTFSAPSEAWRTISWPHLARDPVHHDSCGRGTEVRLVSRRSGGRCTLNANGTQGVYPGYLGGAWLNGGLSTTITMTLFALLNCSCA